MICALKGQTKSSDGERNDQDAVNQPVFALVQTGATEGCWVKFSQFTGLMDPSRA